MTPTTTPEPVLSLPVGIFALGLALMAVGIAALAWLATRRQNPQPPTATLTDAAWLQPLLDAFPHPVILVGAHRRPTAWNQAAAHLWGAMGDTLTLPLALTSLVARVLNAHTTETIEVALPDLPQLADQHRLRASASWLGGGNGVIVQLHDPSDAPQSAEAYRRLISAVAHELRTPLTGILGHADILGSCRPDKDETLWRRSRDFIASEAQRLARLVEDLLTLSRLDLTPLQPGPVNLRAVVEEAISTLYPVAEARGVQLVLQSPTVLPRVFGNRDRLGQVFINLLDNAIKYSPKGGVAGVNLEPERDFVNIEVHDSGTGIAPQDLPYVFDPLYRSEEARDVPGTGLGLTIVRTILEQHDATISVQSSPDHGTKFTFRLPCAQGHSLSLPV